MSVRLARGTAGSLTLTERMKTGIRECGEQWAHMHDRAERDLGGGDTGVYRIQGRGRCDGLRGAGRDTGPHTAVQTPVKQHHHASIADGLLSLSLFFCLLFLPFLTLLHFLRLSLN